MTVKTTIKFRSDLLGAVDASIETVRTARMRACDRADLQVKLDKALADLRAIRVDVATAGAPIKVSGDVP